ncbi:hypothetical protein ACQW5G_04655 [Fructilactobacillus sp. Tb1]|uniref:hypothetical protein n=1 Tax=Fructilactobacillus sp. Tb1 TaxID=3422304 RepID=UPI003D2C4950
MFEIQGYIQKWRGIMAKLAKYKYFMYIPMIAIIFLTAATVVYIGGGRNFMMMIFGILFGLLASIWLVFTFIYQDAKKIMALLNLNDLSSFGNMPQFGNAAKMPGALKHVAKANLIFGLFVLILLVFAVISLLHSSLFTIVIFLCAVVGGLFITLSLVAKAAEKLSNKLPF